MKMQRSTAVRLVAEITAALDAAAGDIISLSDSAKALMSDALARNELSETIDHESAD